MKLLKRILVGPKDRAHSEPDQGQRTGLLSLQGFGQLYVLNKIRSCKVRAVQQKHELRLRQGLEQRWLPPLAGIECLICPVFDPPARPQGGELLEKFV